MTMATEFDFKLNGLLKNKKNVCIKMTSLQNSEIIP